MGRQSTKELQRHRKKKGLIVVLEVRTLGKSRPRDFIPRDGGRLSGSSSAFRPVKSQPAQAFSRSSPCWWLASAARGGVAYVSLENRARGPMMINPQVVELQKQAPTGNVQGYTFRLGKLWCLVRRETFHLKRALLPGPGAIACSQSLSCEKALAGLPCSETCRGGGGGVVMRAWAAQLGLAAFARLITHLPRPCTALQAQRPERHQVLRPQVLFWHVRAGISARSKSAEALWTKHSSQCCQCLIVHFHSATQ